jgi:hypothetical protein
LAINEQLFGGAFCGGAGMLVGGKGGLKRAKMGGKKVVELSVNVK